MKNLNVEKLSKSDFSNRLLSFVKDYEAFLNINIYNDVVDWIIEEKYDLIKVFLSSKPIKDIDRALLDRKKALYEKFISFYE